MFISIRELYKSAEEKNIAIGAFNTSNLEVSQSIISAAEAVKQSLIIQTTPSAIKYAGLKELFSIIKNLIDDSPIPLTIHLDHGKDIELINRCLDVGYRSVMFDGSDKLFEKNVSETKKVVELAHKYGALVEAEVGVIGAGEEGVKSAEQQYTNPSQAAEFAKLTGADSIAVSIGNIHGAPKGESLNIDLLKKINSLVDVPLVLHGASGLSRTAINNAIENGVRKINIDTQIRRAFKASLQESVDNPEMDFREILGEAKDDIEKVVIRYLKIFSQLE